MFLVLSLNIILGFVVDQFSCREAEYFVSVLFLLWAGIGEWMVDSQFLGWYKSAQPCWFQKSRTAGLAKSFDVYGNCLVSYHKSSEVCAWLQASSKEWCWKGLDAINLLHNTIFLLWCSSICSSPNVCTWVIIIVTPSELVSPAGAQIYKINLIGLPFKWRIPTSFLLSR